jgi:hypothetical protein
MDRKRMVVTVLLLVSLGIECVSGYSILRDPAVPIAWKAFFVCAGAPVVVVLVFLVVSMIGKGRK